MQNTKTLTMTSDEVSSAIKSGGITTSRYPIWYKNSWKTCQQSEFSFSPDFSLDLCWSEKFPRKFSNFHTKNSLNMKVLFTWHM